MLRGVRGRCWAATRRAYFSSPGPLFAAADMSTTTAYEVHVVTGDRRGAGTSSSVDIALIGQNGATVDIPVAPTDTFDRNSVAVLSKTSDVDVLDGNIDRVRIDSDGNGLGAGWYLDRIHVEIKNANEDTGTLQRKGFDFLYRKWLGASDSGGGEGPCHVELTHFSETDFAAIAAKSADKLDSGGQRRGLSLGDVPTVSPFQLETGGYCIPHPDKVQKGEKAVVKKHFGHAGEDAFFSHGSSYCGVADGIFAWRDRGIDAGLFSKALVEGAAKKAEAVAERRGYVTSRELFQAGAEHAAECGVHGSSTFCVFSLLPYEGLKEYLTGKNRINHHILNSATSMSYLGRTDVDDVVELFATENMVAQCTNLGDSGVLVGRPSTREVFLRTPQQEHSFGYPFQLGHEDHADGVDDAESFLVGGLTYGDVVVLGSDGLFDNLTEEEILAECYQGACNGRTPQQVAMGLVKAAFDQSMDKKAETPYSMSATEEFNMLYKGGKKDDIAVVVSFVRFNDNMYKPGF